MRQGGPHAETAGKLAGSLINIRAIITHFSPKIDAWSAANKTVALSPEHVLAVVRDNYDTLTLKLQVCTRTGCGRRSHVGVLAGPHTRSLPGQP